MVLDAQIALRAADSKLERVVKELGVEIANNLSKVLGSKKKGGRGSRG